MQTGPTKLSFMQRLAAPEPPIPWSFSTGLFYVIAYGIIWILAVSVASVVTRQTDGVLTPSTWLAAALLHAVVMSAAVIIRMQRKVGATWSQRLRLQPTSSQQFFLVLLVSLGAAWAIDLIGLLTHAKEGAIVPPLFARLVQPFGLGWVVGAVVAIIAQPIAEALVFQGIFYPVAARRTGANWRGILLTMIVQTFLHIVLAVAQGTWYVMIYPLLVSLFVTTIRAYTQSTRLAIVSRMGFGLFVVLAALLSASFSR